MKSPLRRPRAMALVAFLVLIAGSVLISAPARAAVLFSDDFEQPTANVWLPLAGNTWSVTTDSGGSKVLTQKNPNGYAVIRAGTGSRSGTVVSARVKPLSPLLPASLVSVAGQVSSPNHLYYVGLNGTHLLIGQQQWTTNVVLASTPFPAAAGSWYTVRLSFLEPGRVTGTAIGPDGATAAVTATDPGTARSGDAVGFTTRDANASFDDITLSDTLPPPTPPTGTCPIRVDIKAGAKVGTSTLATYTLTNLSSATIAPPWTMTWRFPNGQLLHNVFGSGFQQVGTLVTLPSVPWYQVLPPGVTSTMPSGFAITNPLQAPAEVTFNGYTNCAVTLT